MSLQNLIQPRRVAVVGVSDTPGKFGHSAALNLKKSNLEAVYFVHHRRTEFMGETCYPSLSDLPDAVDCAVLCTPNHTIIPLLSEAGSLNIPAAVVFASGFGEQNSPHSRDLEARMVATAQSFGISVLGPNCLGIYNAIESIYLWSMNGDQEPQPLNSGIGVTAQSGWIVETFVHTPHLRVAYGISTGNGNIVTLEECVEFLVDRPEVNVVSVYIEGLKKPGVFIRALEKAALQRKPVVILKGGRSELGAASAASHTANMMTSHEAFASLLKKYGAILVDDFDQLITLSHTLNVLDRDLPGTPAYGGITLSGGENTLFADLGTAAGLCLPPFAEETKKRLGRHLPVFATPHNPCDATTHLFFNTEAIVGALTAVDSDPDIGAVFVSTNFDLEDLPMWRHFCEAAVQAKKIATKPMIAIPASEGSRNPALRGILEDAGIPIMGAPMTSFKCLKYLSDFVLYEPADRSLEPVRRASSVPKQESRALSELQSKEEMAAAGIPIPGQRLVSHPGELDAALRALGFPLALKINSPDILHKSEVGGVRLDLTSEAEVASAYKAILENVSRLRPDAKIDGVLVQRMLPPGLEMLVGITDDPQLGSMLMVGSGGVYVEILQDTRLYPLPLNRREALELLKQLRTYPLLTGYRAPQPYDIDALVDLMVRLSDYVIGAGGWVKEVDLNPVLVYPAGQGVVAADALVVKYQPERQRAGRSDAS